MASAGGSWERGNLLKHDVAVEPVAGWSRALGPLHYPACFDLELHDHDRSASLSAALHGHSCLQDISRGALHRASLTLFAPLRCLTEPRSR